MGRPTKSAFGGGRRPVDMSKSPQATMQSQGPLSSEAYQAMKAAKRQQAERKKQDKTAARKAKKKL